MRKHPEHMDQVLKSLKNTERELERLLKRAHNPDQIEKTLDCVRELIRHLEKRNKPTQ